MCSFMVSYDPLWSHMVPYGLYGPLWSRMVPYAPIWSSMVMYGSLWCGMVPFSSLWSHMVPFGPEWSPMVLNGFVWSPYISVWSCNARTVPFDPLWSSGVFEILSSPIKSCKISNSRRYLKLCVLVCSTEAFKVYIYIWETPEHLDSYQIVQILDCLIFGDDQPSPPPRLCWTYSTFWDFLLIPLQDLLFTVLDQLILL